MMYLLDTCTFLWELHDDPRISDNASKIIEESDKLYLSIATFWEIAIKKTLKKLEIKESITDLAEVCMKNDITILPIKVNYLERIQTLPFIHNDPFDRLIMATNIEEGTTLVTCDSKIKLYENIKQTW